MKNSPFTFFRKYQREGMVALTVMAMFSFVFLGSTNNYSGSGSARASGSVAVKIAGGDLTVGDLQQMAGEREAINNFIASIIVSTFGSDEENKIPDQMLGELVQNNQFGIEWRPYPPKSDENLIWTHIMRLEAKRLGLVVTDPMVTSYIERMTQKKLTAELFTSARERLKLHERDVYDIFKKELLARNAWLIIHPMMDHTPEQYWEYYRRMKVRQNLEIAALPVSEFAKELKDPGDETLQAFFEKHKKKFPGQGLDPSSPGFRQPQKVGVQYLTAAYEDIEKTIPPITDQEIKDYYEQNKDKLYRELEKPEATTGENTPLDPAIAPEVPPPPALPEAVDPDATKEPAKSTPAEKPAEQPTDKPAVKPADKAAEKATEKPAETPQEKSADKPAEEKPADKPAESKKEKPKAADEPKPEKSCEDQPAAAQEASPAEKTDANSDPAQPAAAKEAEKKSETEKPAVAETKKPEPLKSAPAETKKEDAKPAEKAEPKKGDAAADSKTDKPADEKKSATDGPALDKIEQAPVKYKPLTDELKDDIREGLLRTKTDQALKKLGEAVMQELDGRNLRYNAPVKLKDQTAYIDFNEDEVLDADEPSVETKAKFNPEEIDKIPAEVTSALQKQVVTIAGKDLQAVGKKLGLKYAATGLVSAEEIDKTPGLGKVVEVTDGSYEQGGGAGILNVLFGREMLFNPELGKDSDLGGQDIYVYWKVEQAKSHVPKFSDPGIRDIVLKSWQLHEGYPLAVKRAAELKKLADGKGKLADAIKGQTVTADKSGVVIEVRETADFSWMSPGTPSPQMMFSTPAPVLTKVDFVEEPSDEFMELACEKLAVGEVGFAPNRDHTYVYVMRVIHREPKPGEETARMRETFMKERLFPLSLGMMSLPSAYSQIGSSDATQLIMDWMEGLKQRYQISYTDEEKIF